MKKKGKFIRGKQLITSFHEFRLTKTEKSAENRFLAPSPFSLIISERTLLGFTRWLLDKWLEWFNLGELEDPSAWLEEEKVEFFKVMAEGFEWGGSPKPKEIGFLAKTEASNVFWMTEGTALTGAGVGMVVGFSGRGRAVGSLSLTTSGPSKSGRGPWRRAVFRGTWGDIAMTGALDTAVPVTWVPTPVEFFPGEFELGRTVSSNGGKGS